MSLTAPRDWDAETYDRVSSALEALGREVLERLELRGDEAVLDAGCGTGRVTKALLERLPRGRVIAVDASPSMVEIARKALGPRAEVRVANLLELELEEPVDVVFSTATFHWIADHDRLFRRLRDALVPGGRLLAQCGGEGNIAAFTAQVREVCEAEPFASHFAEFSDSLHFASPEATVHALEGAGFIDVECRLEPRAVVPDEPHAYLAAICLGALLEVLPAELHDEFVAAVVARMPSPPTLDYIRLNFTATRP